MLKRFDLGLGLGAGAHQGEFVIRKTSKARPAIIGHCSLLPKNSVLLCCNSSFQKRGFSRNQESNTADNHTRVPCRMTGARIWSQQRQETAHYYSSFLSSSRIQINRAPESFLRQCLRGTCNHRPSGRRTLPLMRTSEFWWEEEEEYDAMTDALRAKLLFIVSTSAKDNAMDIEATRQHLQKSPFVVGFCGPDVKDTAAALWEGRDTPPLFLKMRPREALGCATANPSGFLSDCLAQNWRLDLDAGLGVADPPAEAILIVCSPEVATQLVQISTGDGVSIRPRSSSLVAIGVHGTRAGELADWKSLRKEVYFEPHILSLEKCMPKFYSS